MTSDSIEIREHIMQLYETVYAEQFSWWPKLDGLLFFPLMRMIRDLNGDKAPGPNGFSMDFF
jgi:hypothetical protein